MFGLLKKLFSSRKKGRYTIYKINRMFGKWEPYTGKQIINGSSLPKYIELPAAVRKFGDDPGQCSFDTAVFPYWLRIDPSHAGYYVSKIHSGAMYAQKELSKKDGEIRIISSPDFFLKVFQRRILERILYQIDVHEAAHGFVPQRSVFSAAGPHVNQPVVITMDLKDFFGTITFRRVVGMFRAYGLKEKTACLLAGLCCFQGKLPQGAPTSPMISNIICRRLDARLSGLAEKNGFQYTRYADDLIFSGPLTVMKFIPFIRTIINDEGFELADKKTCIKRSGARQKVLGLNVNTKVSVPRKVRRVIKAMLYRQSADGSFGDDFRTMLNGHIAFMKPAHAEESKRYKKILKGIC